MSSSRARTRRIRVLVLAVLLVGLLLASLIRAVVSSFDHACEVCVTYRGRTVCREAIGSTRDKAEQAARERACEFLTAESAAENDCLGIEPASVKCRTN